MGTSAYRSRTTASVVMLVIGAVLLIAGTVALYAREQIVDREAFANRTIEALDDDGVRTVVGREIVVYLAERGSADLAAARPLLESVVDTLIQTEPFQRVFRSAAREANRVFFVRDKENVLLDLGDGAEIVRFGLRSVSPNLAKQLPDDLKPDLLALQRQRGHGHHAARRGQRPHARDRAAAARAPAAGRRGRGSRRSPRGGAPSRASPSARPGTILLVALVVLKARTLAGVYGEDEVTDEELRATRSAVSSTPSSATFSTWALLLALLGIAVAAAAAALDPEDVEAPAERMRRLTQRPRATWARALRGVAALVVGVLAVLEPRSRFRSSR